jgi:hypothetical protein
MTCTWDWNISGITDNNYWIAIEISSGPDSNTAGAERSFKVNPGPQNRTRMDVNLSHIDGTDDAAGYPMFSYPADGNLTIDFNFATDTNFGTHQADINYSTANTQGTGTAIVTGLTIDSNYCQTNFVDTWNNTASSDVNLIGYWKFDTQEDDYNTSQAFDYSGSENHGLYIGGADNNAQGKWDNNAFFGDDVDNSVTVTATGSDLNILGNEVSIIAWINEVGTAGFIAGIPDDVGSPWAQHYSLRTHTSNEIRWWTKTTNGSVLFTTTDTVPQNQWNHIAATYDGSNMHVYINGLEVSDGPQAQTGNLKGNGEKVFKIGEDAARSTTFEGQIDEVKVWNRALTASEVLTDFNLGLRNHRKCSWDWNISGIADGNYFALINTKDGAENEDFNYTTYSFTTDNTAPTATITAPADGSSQTSTTVTLTYTGSDATSGIKRYWVRADSDNWIDNSTNLTYAFTSQTRAAHDYYVKAQDNADNNSTATTVQVTISSAATTTTDDDDSGTGGTGYSGSPGGPGGQATGLGTIDTGTGPTIELARSDKKIVTGQVLDFTYTVTNPGENSIEVQMNYWVEKEGERVVEHSETVVVGAGEQEEIEGMLELGEAEIGNYELFIEMAYGEAISRLAEKFEIAEFVPLDLDLSISRLPTQISPEPTTLRFTIGSNRDERTVVKVKQVILKGNEVVWNTEEFVTVKAARKMLREIPALEPGDYRWVITATAEDELETIQRNIKVRKKAFEERESKLEQFIRRAVDWIYQKVQPPLTGIYDLRPIKEAAIAAAENYFNTTEGQALAIRAGPVITGLEGMIPEFGGIGPEGQAPLN